MMAHHKNFNRKSGRIEVQKLTVALSLGLCIVLITYLISTEPSANQKISMTYNVAQVRPFTVRNYSHKQKDGVVQKSISSSKLPEDKTVIHHKNLGKKVYTENSSPTNFSNPKKDIRKHNKPDERIKDLKPSVKTICDMSNPRSDICDMEGDIRVHGKSYSVIFVDNYLRRKSEMNEWSIRPYARKEMKNIPKVTVRLLSASAGAPTCTVNHTIPAILFANGGFAGNYFHDFTDILVPLFATARQFFGEVQFVVNNIQHWWLQKYQEIMKDLSHYEIIDFDHDEQVHCFPRVIVGMHFYNELIIDPRRSPYGLSMPDFTKFMRTTYSLPRDIAINLKEESERKPRLLIIARHGTRKFTNVDEIARMARELNFDVVVDDAKFEAKVASVAKSVNSFDVMVGVHGAGLTNLVFLPTNAVLIQIVPWGRLENLCKNDFGFASIDANLHYLQYSICEEESTLLEHYPRNHSVFVDPKSIHKLGWIQMGKIYLVQQDVKINVSRFRPVLQQALQHLSQ